LLKFIFVSWCLSGEMFLHKKKAQKWILQHFQMNNPQASG
jgi:hypothetical protein